VAGAGRGHRVTRHDREGRPFTIGRGLQRQGLVAQPFAVNPGSFSQFGDCSSHSLIPGWPVALALD